MTLSGGYLSNRPLHEAVAHSSPTGTLPFNLSGLKVWMPTLNQALRWWRGFEVSVLVP